MVLWDWLLSLSIMWVGFDHIVACIRTPFLLLNTIPVFDTQHFIYPLMQLMDI